MKWLLLYFIACVVTIKANARIPTNPDKIKSQRGKVEAEGGTTCSSCQKSKLDKIKLLKVQDRDESSDEDEEWKDEEKRAKAQWDEVFAEYEALKGKNSPAETAKNMHEVAGLKRSCVAIHMAGNERKRIYMFNSIGSRDGWRVKDMPPKADINSMSQKV